MMRTLICLGLIAMTSPAFANVGRSSGPGAAAGEPGGLGAIAIEHEDLAFDLRPIAAGEPARVTATYRLVNRGEAVTAPLVFVAGALIDRIAITLDDEPQPVRQDRPVPVPESWRPPATTPALDGGRPLGYEIHRDNGEIGATAVEFTLTMPPGTHRLAIAYTAQASWDKVGHGTIVRQLGYVLAPARTWGGFGTLDVTVDVAPGWKAAVEPALARDGDTLRGHFDRLPADTIGITVRAPVGMWNAVAQILAWIAFAGVLAGGILALVVLGRRGGTRLWGLAWGAAIAVSGTVCAIAPGAGIPADQDARHGYGSALAILFSIVLGVIAVPIGAVIVWAGRKRTRPPT